MKFKRMGQGNPLTVPPSRQIVRWGRGLGPPLTVPSPEETPDTEQSTALLKDSRTGLTWADLHSPPSPTRAYTRSHQHTHAHMGPSCLHLLL